MQHSRPTLKQSLTTTIFLWGIGFLVIVLTLFFIFSNSIEAYIIAMVHSDSFAATTLSTTLGWLAVFILTLLLIAVKGLHFSLNRQLVEPVEHLRMAIEEHHSTEDIHRLIASLPYETARILDVHDQLKHSLDHLKNRVFDIMEVLPACIWWSHDGQTYAGMTSKAETILHIPAAEFTDQALWGWINAKAQKSSHIRQLQQAIDKGEESLGLAYQVQIGDKAYWYGESLMICYDHHGQLDTIYGFINDISTRKSRQKEQAEQLELAHRMETTATLVGGIAHEFNNALAGMNGNVFLIKQCTTDQDNLQRIGRIEQLIERSALMIDQMLTFAHKSSMVPGPIALADFLNSIQSAVLHTVSDQTQFNLCMDSSIQHDKSLQAVIRADQQKLQEVLMQLIQNANFAVDHISNPRITITLENFEADEIYLRKYPQVSSRHLVHLQVQDNGTGIPVEIQHRIFEPFFTSRDVGQGTGLGLSMVYGYITQIGGVIDVESKVGHGTTFHIYLPRITAPLSSSHDGPLLRGHGEKVLVVDDDSVFRESTCEVLNRMGYHSIEARDGKDAVDIFEQHQHDIQLIFMDILMPGMTGIQASRRIRAINPDVPIIYLTAYDRTQSLEPEIYEEHTELINKPFRISTLSQAIQKALKQTNNA